MPVRILLADENLAVQKLVELTLNKEGIEVTTTDNGLSALDIAIKNPPDVILADFKMEGLDIASFIQKTKKRERLSDIPIILLVNATETHDPIHLQALGAETFFKKPLDTQELISVIKRLTASSDEAFDMKGEHSNPEDSELSQHFSSSEDETKTISEMLGWSLPENEGPEKANQEDDEQTLLASPSSGDIFQGESEDDERTLLAGDLEENPSLFSRPSDAEGVENDQERPIEDPLKGGTAGFDPQSASAPESAPDPFDFPFGEGGDPFSQSESDPEISLLDEQTILPPSAASEVGPPPLPEAEAVPGLGASFEPSPNDSPETALPNAVSFEAPLHQEMENGAALDDKLMKAVEASTEKILKTLLPAMVKSALSNEMIANIVEEVTWEAVTPLAEAEIKKAIKQLQAETDA